MPSLRRSQPIEPVVVSTDNGKAVLYLAQPEFEVGDVADKVVTVEGNEFRQLVGEQFDDLGGVWHRSISLIGRSVARTDHVSRSRTRRYLKSGVAE